MGWLKRRPPDEPVMKTGAIHLMLTGYGMHHHGLSWADAELAAMRTFERFAAKEPSAGSAAAMLASYDQEVTG